MTDTFSLSNKTILDNLYALDNEFIRKLGFLVLSQIKQGNLVHLFRDSTISNHSKVCYISELPPIENSDCKTLGEEIAIYHLSTLNLGDLSADFCKIYEKVLVADYFLSSCLCFVETIARDYKIEKYFATRNRALAAYFSKTDLTDTNHLVNYLKPLILDYESSSLRILILNNTKKGLKMKKTKHSLSFDCFNLRVTPFFFVSALIEGIGSLLKTNILKVTYLDDRLVHRELHTTTSREILLHYYEQERVDALLKRKQVKLEQGSISVPELGASKYDETGIKDLSITRIIAIEIMPNIDISYIDIDFEKVEAHIRQFIDTSTDTEHLILLHQKLNLNYEKTWELNYFKHLLINCIDNNLLVNKTTYLKMLHHLMLDNPILFKDYSTQINLEKRNCN